MEPLMPMLLHCKRRQADRWLEHAHTLLLRERLTQSTWHYNEQLGLRNDARHGQEARYLHDDAPPIALLRKHLVDDGVTGARRGHHDVSFGQEGPLARSRPYSRVSFCGQADEVLLEQSLLVEAGFEVRHEANRQVDFA